MLSACHERVERTLKLLARLRRHIDQVGCDSMASEAAIDVLRYFDMAAPRHHEDEELHVFPIVLAHGGSGLNELVRKLQQDHVAMEQAWSEARKALIKVRDAGLPDHECALTESEQLALDHFEGLYAQHIKDEDLLVYPAAQGLLTAEQVQAMGADMWNRRSLAVTQSCEKA